MPMPVPPPGGLPSPMTQNPANAGSMGAPQGNQGNIQAAMVKVSGAVKMLQEALPLIPLGSEGHTTLAKVINDLSKGIAKAQSNPQLEIASMHNSQKNVAQDAKMAAMARMISAQQGQGQPPAMPQTDAA